MQIIQVGFDRSGIERLRYVAIIRENGYWNYIQPYIPLCFVFGLQVLKPTFSLSFITD